MTETTRIPSPQRLEVCISRLEAALDNIVDFWLPRCIDERYGGYHLNHGTHGEDLGPGWKQVTTQARMVWLFSRLAREGYRPPEMLAAAEHGYRFLTEHAQDPRYGGYYWLFKPDGTPRRVRKHMCGQSFVIYALAEYAAASGREESLIAVEALFDLVETAPTTAQTAATSRPSGATGRSPSPGSDPTSPVAPAATSPSTPTCTSWKR